MPWQGGRDPSQRDGLSDGSAQPQDRCERPVDAHLMLYGDLWARSASPEQPQPRRGAGQIGARSLLNGAGSDLGSRDGRKRGEAISM
jgi:hypothetical protein